MTTADARPREPKYYTVKRHLLETHRTLPPGSPVPTERELAAELSTSRTTVRQALVELVAEGRLVRRQGAGTFIAEPKMTWPLHLTSFTEAAAANGFAASTRLIAAGRVRAEAEVASRLGLAAGAPVVRIERLRLADDRPMAVETSHLSARRFPNLSRHIRRRPVAVRAAARGLRRRPGAGRGAHRHRAGVAAGGRPARHRTGAPMLVLGRHSRDADGAPVEWVTSWYRGDRVTFVADLSAPRPDDVARSCSHGGRGSCTRRASSTTAGCWSRAASIADVGSARTAAPSAAHGGRPGRAVAAAGLRRPAHARRRRPRRHHVAGGDGRRGRVPPRRTAPPAPSSRWSPRRSPTSSSSSAGWPSSRPTRTATARWSGAHLEGPFLSHARCGAQNPAHLRLPDRTSSAGWSRPRAARCARSRSRPSCPARSTSSPTRWRPA